MQEQEEHTAPKVCSMVEDFRPCSGELTWMQDPETVAWYPSREEVADAYAWFCEAHLDVQAQAAWDV